MASRNGLNPKIKGPKGVGFGRALPAPFGFDNGIKANNSSLRIPGLERGWLYNPEFTFEFWTKCNAGSDGGIYLIWANIRKNTTPAMGVQFNINGPLGAATTDSGFTTSGTLHNYDGSRQHIVYRGNGDGSFSIYYNGVFQGNLPGQLSQFAPTEFSLFYQSANYEYDEIRYYTKALRADEVALNYNAGIGANPCVTEYLLFWYQFESFENLDFSALQDGTDMRIGVRDMSNQNNHALPVGMDTNPASPTYSIKPF